MDNLIIEKHEDGDVTLRLSNYAAYALLRRLQGDAPCDPTEAQFVAIAVAEIAETLDGDSGLPLTQEANDSISDQIRSARQ